MQHKNLCKINSEDSHLKLYIISLLRQIKNLPFLHHPLPLTNNQQSPHVDSDVLVSLQFDGNEVKPWLPAADWSPWYSLSCEEHDVWHKSWNTEINLRPAPLMYRAVRLEEKSLSEWRWCFSSWPFSPLWLRLKQSPGCCQSLGNSQQGEAVRSLWLGEASACELIGWISDRNR